MLTPKECTYTVMQKSPHVLYMKKTTT